MTGFQISPSLANANPTQPLAGNIYIRGVDGSERVIPIGQTLEVVARQSNSGESGVYLRGQFVPATLPPGVKDGEKLSVKVVGNQDALVLRILNPSGLNSAPYTSSTVRDIIQALLPNLNFDNLRQAAKTLRQELPAALLQQLAQDSSLPVPKPAKGETPLAQNALTKAIERLLSKHVLLSQTELQDPKAVERYLENLGQNQFLRTLTEAKATVEKLAKQSQNPLLQKFATALEEHLKALTKSPEKFGFESPGTGSALMSQQIRLYLAASQQAAYTGDTNTLDRLAKFLTQLSPRDNPIQSLLAGLSFFEFAGPDTLTSQEQTFTDLVRTLAKELAALKDTKGGDKEIRDVLNKALAKLQAFLEPNRANALESQNAGPTLTTLRALENLLHGQESLNQLNPLMQFLGQPALVFVPALIDGVLSRWEMSVRGRPGVDEDADSGRKAKKGANGYERVELSLNLPGLGQVGIELAHRKEEVLLNITVDSQELADFISPRLGTLDEALKKLGYTNTLLKAQMGKPETVTPSWYHDLIKQTIIA